MLKYLIQRLANKNKTKMLGRWSLKQDVHKEDITVFNTNRDHCGDVLCGDPFEHIKLSPKNHVKSKITNNKSENGQNSEKEVV